MISRSDFSEYARTNQSLISMAMNTLNNYLNAVDFNNKKSARAIEQTIVAIYNNYGSALARNAANFYEKTSQKKSIDTAQVVGNVLLSQTQRLALKRAVAVAVALGIAGATATAVKALAQRVNVGMKVIPATVMERNARRHGDRYARVPQGAYTCPFCTMLAGRGFVYYSKESAGAFKEFHDHCDCEVIASSDPRVEGYDYSIYENQYRDARKYIEPVIEERWKNLSDEDKDYYRGKAQKKSYMSGDAYNEYLTRSILAQMRAMRTEKWKNSTDKTAVVLHRPTYEDPLAWPTVGMRSNYAPATRIGKINNATSPNPNAKFQSISDAGLYIERSRTEAELADRIQEVYDDLLYNWAPDKFEEYSAMLAPYIERALDRN